MDDLRLRNYSSTQVREDVRVLLGAALVADWRQALIARGFGWGQEVGTLTTPVAGGGTGGTVLDLEQPQLVLNVPSGYAMVPLRISVETQIGLQTTDSHESEIWIGFDRTQVQANGTSTAGSPYNLRSDIVATAPFTARHTYTADGVATPVITTLARKQGLTDIQGTAATVNVYQFDLIYEPSNPPIIIGPANISVYWGGSIAVNGFAQAKVLAFPASLVTSLS